MPHRLLSTAEVPNAKKTLRYLRWQGLGPPDFEGEVVKGPRGLPDDSGETQTVSFAPLVGGRDSGLLRSARRAVNHG